MNAAPGAPACSAGRVRRDDKPFPPTWLGLFRMLDDETKDKVRAFVKIVRPKTTIRKVMHDAMTEAMAYIRGRERAHRKRGLSKRAATRAAARDFDRRKKYPRSRRVK